MPSPEFPGPFDVVTVTLNPAIDRTLTVPRFTPGAVNRATHEESRAGGKGINVAAALANLGHRVAASGILGADNDAIFRALFAALRIEDACLRVPGATRLGLKVFDPEKGQTTDINLPGLIPGSEALGQIDATLQSLPMVWCVLAGSLPPGVPVTVYADLIRRLRARGIRVALDTSGEPLRAALSAGASLLKPNRHELEQVLGHRLDSSAAVLEAARRLLDQGIAEVILSDGESGAWFVTSDAALHARPPRIDVRSTVGAGDALVAGALSAHLRGLPPAERARFATASSLIALTRAPTDRFDPARHAAFCAQVEVTEA